MIKSDLLSFTINYRTCVPSHFHACQATPSLDMHLYIFMYEVAVSVLNHQFTNLQTRLLVFSTFALLFGARTIGDFCL